MEFTSGIGNAMPELPSKRSRNWSTIHEVNSFTLLIKSEIDFQNWRGIPISVRRKSQKLTSGIENKFLPLLEGNSGIAFPMSEVISSL